MSTRPSSPANSPARMRNSVDLPTPFAPTSPTCCPGEILNDTSANSRSPPGCAYARFETMTCDIPSPGKNPTNKRAGAHEQLVQRSHSSNHSARDLKLDVLSSCGQTRRCPKPG